MARLPLVQATAREWLEPEDIREALRLQSPVVCPAPLEICRTLVVFVAPATFFFLSVLPSVEPAESSLRQSSQLSAAGAVLFLFVAALRNPGVVPRPMNAPKLKAPANPGSMKVRGVSVQKRFCTTCRHQRPLRSSHCRACDRCIFRFDHHCIWIGNCVGLGNYRSFLCLIVLAAVFFGHAALVTFKAVRSAAEGVSGASSKTGAWRQAVLGDAWLLALFLFYAIVMFSSLASLCLYHSRIIATNRTTNEHLRNYYPTKNPFDAGCLPNYWQVLCVPYGQPVRAEAGRTSEMGIRESRRLLPS